MNKFIVAAILILGFILRVYNPNALPVFVDEAIYVRWAQVMRADETLRFLPLSDGKQPLFMWVMIPFLKIIKDPLVAGRLPSALSGIGTTAIVMAITYSLLRSKKITLLSGVMTALSPYLIFFDRLALVDSFLTFWGMLTLLLSIHLIKKPRLDLAILTGAALGGSWLTKSPGELFFLLLPAAIFLVKRRNPLKASYVFKLAGSLLIAWIIGLGFYNILRLGPNFHLIGSRNSDYIYSLSELITHPGSPLISNLSLSADWFIKLLPFPLLLTAAVGLISGLTSLPGTTIFVSVWTFLPIFINTAIGKVFTARYLLYIVPPLLILTSWGIDKLFNQTRISRTVFLLLVCLPMFLQDFLFATDPAKAFIPQNERHGYLEEWTSGYGLREIASYLKNRPVTTPIVVGTEGFFGTLPDGLEIYLDKNQNIRFVGLSYPVKSVPQSLTDALKQNDVYLVVNQSRFEIADPQKTGLTLIAAYPRPVRPDGTFDTTLFFRLIKNVQ